MTRRAQFIHARVVSVYELNDGDQLDGDTASGATSLAVLDASDFDDEGGMLVIDGEDVLAYSTCDYVANTITLTDPTTSDWADESRVELYPITPTRYAQVLTLDDDDEDFAEARVPHHYVPLINVGPRLAKKNQESVVLIHDGHEWAIFDVLGKRAKLTADHAPAERTFRYTAEGIAPDGYQGVKIKGYDGTAIAARMYVTTAPTSLATFKLQLNNANIATLTIAAGKHWSATFDVTDTFDENDQWRVEFTDPADAGANVVLYLYVTLNVDDEDLS